MSDPNDDPGLDRILSEAFADEADRARPAPDAWAHVSDEIRRRERPRRWLPAAAAAVLLLAGAVSAAVLLRDDGGRVVQVATEPTTASTVEPATEGPSTSMPAVQTTTTVPEPEVVSDPIEMGPPPPSRSTPPEMIAAVATDGRLVLLDTATGAVTREVADHGDLRDRDEVGMSSGVDDVALSPSGDRVWYSVCCEPAAGSLHEALLDPAAEPIRPDPPVPEQPTRFADAYSPAFSPSARWATSATYWASVWDLEERERRDWSPNDGGGFSWAVLSPGGQRLVVAPWSFTGEVGSVLQVIDTERATTAQRSSPGVEAVRRIVAEPRDLPGGGWTHPTFGRDGRLLAAQHSDGTWTPRLIDIETGEVTDAGWSYGGVPLDQDHDPSGEWLLYVVADSPDSLEGTLRWVGPNGETGTVPGTYYAASW